MLPAVRGWVKGWFLRRYLSKLYQGELSNTPGRQWTAIAHPSEHLAESSLNVPQETGTCEAHTKTRSAKPEGPLELVFTLADRFGSMLKLV